LVDVNINAFHYEYGRCSETDDWFMAKNYLTENTAWEGALL
jgi:hypothetical protein